MSKSSFIRYVWLVNTIRQYKKITLAKLQEKWSVSSYNDNKSDLTRRTFINHKDAILEMFDIEIKVDGHHQYYIEEEEINNDIRDTMLDAFAVSNIFTMQPSLKGRILFEPMPSGQKFLVKIIEAMSASKTLQILHQRFGNYDQREHICKPLTLKCYNRRWYLIAQSCKHEENIYPLSLDRIKEVKILEETFEMPKNFDVENYFRNCVGIVNIENMKVERVIFKAKDYAADYIRTLPLHHSQRELYTENSETFFELYVQPNFELKQLILAQVEGLEVLEPKAFREDIAQSVATLAERYSKE